MAYNGLADFLEELATLGELVRVDAEVDPQFEIAEITRRIAADKGPALLFERVRGHSIAVLTNLLGTSRRASLTLGIDSLHGIAERINGAAAQHTPQNWFERLKISSGESGIDRLRPKLVKSGLSQQVVHLGRDVNLATLPLLRSWPDESGPSVTAGLLVTTGQAATHVGSTCCPLVVVGDNQLAVIDDGHSPFATHWAEHSNAGLKMPMAVVLGGDPAARIAAQIDLPRGLEVYHLLGLLRGKPLEMVKCRTHDLLVPIDAEMIVEGYLDPQSKTADVRLGGAGVTHYRTLEAAPILHVSAVTHRNRPIFPAFVDAGLHGEAAMLAVARERMLLPALQDIAPDITDLSLPLLGGLHRFAFVALHKWHPHQARQVAAALWGTEALKFTKFLVLLDAGVNVHDVVQVWTQVGANVAARRDIFAFDGLAHAADHAGTTDALAQHLAIDATSKLPGEQPGSWPATLDAGEETRRQVTSRWTEYGFPEIRNGSGP